MNDIQFNGRVAIVTGAGNGLGRDYALNLARRGALVVVNDLGGGPLGGGASHDVADAVVDQIRAAGGGAVASYDSVSSKSGGQAIAQTALEAFGRIDILINNAGIVRTGLFTNLKTQDLDAMLATHLYGALYVTQPCFDVMKQNRYGRIVFTSSGAASFGVSGFSAYSAAKAALIGLMNVVAIEGAPHGILSNALLPGALGRMNVAIGESAASKEGAIVEAGVGDHNVDHAVSEITILHKFLVPEFVTPMALFLCSEGCQLSHSMFSAVAGVYARTFIALTQGWVAPDEKPPSVRDIAAHLEQIQRPEGWWEPANGFDELKRIAEVRRSLSQEAPTQ